MGRGQAGAAEEDEEGGAGHGGQQDMGATLKQEAFPSFCGDRRAKGRGGG